MMTQSSGSFIDRFGGYGVLAVALLIVLGVWAFIALADRVIQGQTQHFDDRIVQALQKPDPDWKPDAPRPTVPRGPRALQQAGRDISALGGTAVLGIVIAVTAGYFLLTRRYRSLWLILIATLGGVALGMGLKYGFARARPPGEHMNYVFTPGFPSGHTMLSAIVYLTLGSLLMRLERHKKHKAYFLAVALGLTFLIGISRIYIGVHYPTDVLAGWTAGLVWAMLCWLAARWLQRRGMIDKKTESARSGPDDRADSMRPRTAEAPPRP